MLTLTHRISNTISQGHFYLSIGNSLQVFQRFYRSGSAKLTPHDVSHILFACSVFVCDLRNHFDFCS